MKHLLRISIGLLLLSCVAVAQTTTYTGTIKDLSNATVTSGKVMFTQKPYADTTISGTARFVSGTPVTCKINGSGLLKANDGVSACVVVNNTMQSPGGTYYQIDICPYNACSSRVNGYALGGTVDISTLVPTPATTPMSTVADTISQQTIGGNKTFSGSESFTGSVAVGVLNKICVVDGVVNSTLAAAVACASSTGVVEVAPIVSPVMTGNVTIPSGVTLQMDGGACITTTGYTLTINGPLVAPETAQVFCGSGTVTGLKLVRPEWFGTTVINAQIQSAFGAAGGILALRNTTYQSAFTNGVCWTTSNVWFQGSGEPFANGTYTALTGGTVIQAGLGIAGANSIRITNLGVDNGSAYAGTSTWDGLTIGGTTGACGVGNPADALVTGTYVENVSAMLSSGAAAFHTFRFEHTIGTKLRNLTAYFGQHGLALKSIDSSLIGYTAYGQGNDAFIAKTDSYTATGGLLVADMRASTINSSNTLNRGIILDAEGSVQLSNVTISNVLVVNAAVGVLLQAGGSFGAGAINGVNISNLTYVVNSNSMGIGTGYCINSTGAGSQTATWVHINNSSCLNSSAVPFTPLVLSIPLTTSVIENTHTAGSNSVGSTLSGTNLTINNYTETNVTATKPFVVSANSTIYLTGYQSAVGSGTSTVDPTSTLNVNSASGQGLGFTLTTGVIYSGSLTTVSALATPTILQGSGSNAGILRVRDNTSGGTATFVIDPNSGSTAIAGTVTGLAAAGVTFSSGQWRVSLSSGSTPRVLSWTILD